MCGIVGFITTETDVGEAARSKFLKQALIIDTLRGDDSTGVFTVGHEPQYEDGSAYYLKQVGPGQEFVDSKDYWENLYDVKKLRCVVGHNRAATMGSVTAKNAHPFQEGHITLVHNGTLTSANVLPSPMSSLDGITVDSQAIAANLNKHSVKEVVENLYGAFALVWHDARDNSVNVVRNTKRPLHFAMGQDGKSMFFMSEGEMLHLLDKRLNLKLKQVYFPEEGQHLKWGPDTPLDAPEVTALELYEDKWPTSWQNSTGYHDNRYGGYGSYGYDSDDDDVFALDNGFVHTKSQAHRPQEDHIFVGGRRQEIPMLLQEAMLIHDITVEDRLRFTPRSYQQNPQDTTKAIVSGIIEGTHQAVLYSQSNGTVANCMNQDWTVRVIAVNLNASGEPWFVCRLVSTFVNPGMLTSQIRKSLLPNRVPGCDGQLVTHADYIAQVLEGCLMCYHAITIQDAHDVVWTPDGPICPSCDDRLYEPAEEIKDVTIIH